MLTNSINVELLLKNNLNIFKKCKTKNEKMKKLTLLLTKSYGKFIPISYIPEIFNIKPHTLRYHIDSKSITTLKAGLKVFIKTSDLTTLIFDNYKNLIEVKYEN
ncbi:hypothetical protein NON08_06175 [Cetobacterium somerae]|uniref:hypothetical protein n=1 Tax=Cetobacterium sp. NK01 TaxID=2993530 RepID=UPI002116E328|nr:hypothetical protein [Cetobacterium sp. NK01]MCQ8212110.1 hypothetical protein [Cetobacterium sp. NK01]